jgi:hypothetical protein
VDYLTYPEQKYNIFVLYSIRDCLNFSENIIIGLIKSNGVFIGSVNPVIANLKGEAIQMEVAGLLRVNPRNDAEN